MNRLQLIFLASSLVAAASIRPLSAEPTVATGAGYKGMVTALNKDYRSSEGKEFQILSGNMGQVIAFGRSGRPYPGLSC